MKSSGKLAKRVAVVFPAGIIVLLIPTLGLGMAVFESLSSGMATYTSALALKEFRSSLTISLIVATISTLCSLLFGLLLTKGLIQLFSKDLWKYIVWVPMLIPHFIGAYIIYSFWSQPGLISSLAYELEFIDSIDEFPVLISNQYYSGVILSYIWKETPFVVLMLLPVYQEIDKRHNDVVRTLGGGTWAVFKTAEWPWVFPVLAETGIILISFITFGFEIPALLGVTYPKMLSILSYQWFYEGDWSMRPHAQAIMIFVTFFLLLFTYIIIRFIRKKQRFLKGSHTS